LIQAPGEVIELPPHVLAGQGKELPDRRRPCLPEGLEQPLDHGAEQFVRLEVKRRLR
jgi:hypothetical protein